MHSSAPIVSFDDEPLICVDESDNVLGHASKRACHDGDGTLHRALSVFVFDDEQRVLLQQRSSSKRLWPGWWANSCCSHPRRGEDIVAAAARRVREELTLSPVLVHTHSFVYHARWDESGSEYELCHVFVGRGSDEPAVNPHEVQATRWVTPETLDALVADDNEPITPWLRLEWRALRQEHWPLVVSLKSSSA